jgi:hypothetical protein
VIRTSAKLIGIGGILFSIWLVAVCALALSNSGRGGAGRLDHYAGVREHGTWFLLLLNMATRGQVRRLQPLR